MMYSTEQYRTVRYSAVQYRIVLDSKEQYMAVQYIVVHAATAQTNYVEEQQFTTTFI